MRLLSGYCKKTGHRTKLFYSFLPCYELHRLVHFPSFLMQLPWRIYDHRRKNNFLIYQESQEKHYQEFSDELLGRLADELTGHLPLGFEQGLSGIVGIGYLIQQGLVSDDSDRVFENFNLLFREKLMGRHLDMHAVVGIGIYLVLPLMTMHLLS